MPVSLFLISTLGLGAVAVLVLVADVVVGVVPRRRVEEFARLHSLRVTPANEAQIIAYRATTRRWRTAGFAVGALVPLAVTGPVFLNFQWALAGWFGGAALAELRVAQLVRGPRASASLMPRRVSDYLPRAGRWAVPGAIVMCALTAAYCVARRGTHPDTDLGDVAFWAFLGLGLGFVALAAQRYILRRPQPLAEPDQLAADDAIRSRSMHVLAAAGMVLVGSCLSAQLDVANVLHHNHTTGVFDAALGFGFPIAGRILAYWPSAPRRSGSAPSTPSKPAKPSAPEPA
jgi:hypothetical protein